MNIVLMAGGGGTRLWPLSRQSLPKQFLSFDGETLLKKAHRRAVQLADREHIFVATNERYLERTREELPEIDAAHLLTEPEKRDTTAAFASVCLRLQALGRGDEPTIFMWCDHVFTNESLFVTDLGRIASLVEEHPETLVVLGHKPTNPETTLGYIKVRESLPGKIGVFMVDQFVEKPNRDTAETYVTSGEYYWNLGYFSLKPSYLLTQLKKLTPTVVPAINAYEAAIAANDDDALRQAYGMFEKISIEYSFVEKTSLIIMVANDYGWSDVGNWKTVGEVFGVTGDHVPRGHHIHVDSENNYIYNTTNRAVSTIGMKNTVIVVTDDAVLVTDRDSAAKVKEVVAQLEEEGRSEFL